MKPENIMLEAIMFYGAQAQEAQAIEECAELIQAINKKWRGNKSNIVEEIADVEIMLEQLKMINNCGGDVETIKAFKLHRLKDRITLQRAFKEEKNEKQ